MNKKSFISKLSGRTKIKKDIVEKLFKSGYELIVDILLQGESINFSGFGRLYVKERGERQYINFQTGDSFLSPPRLYPAIKFSPKFTELL